jgi:hypothetical protein
MGLSAGLVPLVLYLAQMSEEQPNQELH